MKNNKCKKVPLLIQMESTECGAACLGMILAYYKKWIPLEVLRVDCGVSRDGSSAKDVLNAGRNYGLDVKAYSVGVEYLKEKVELPCIIHWNFNHFVVLCGFKNGKAIINDPAKGRHAIPEDIFDESFTGICLTFAPTEKFEPSGKPKSLWRFARARILENKSIFVLIALTVMISSFVGIAIPGFTNMFTQELLIGRNLEYLNPFIYALGISILIKFLADAIKEFYSYKADIKIDIVGSSRYIWHIFHLPMEFFAQRGAGDLQYRKRANSEVNYTFVIIFAPLIVKCVMMLFYLSILMQYSTLLSLVGILSIVIDIILSAAISQKRVNLTSVYSRDEGNLISATVSGIEMMETIKVNGAENDFFGKWAGYQACVNNDEAEINRLETYMGMLPQNIRILCNTLIFMGGVYYCMNEMWTIGMLTAFMGLFSAFLDPVKEVVDYTRLFLEMRSDMERIEDIMEYPTDLINIKNDENPDAVFDKLKGNIQIKNLTFGYSRLKDPLIKDFSLDVKPGQRIALVGSSGSGKSTIANLLSGLYQPWSGEILYDGKPLAEIDKSILTSSVAVVNQEITLFEDSIANNIKMWDSSIEDFEMILAARDAQLHKGIMNRDGGYQFEIASGGVNLSGGERQRLEIARVLAVDPTIVIMDEATSALDARTEAHVVESIANRGITCIVIAHRLSTIKDSDEIVVLDHGQIVERGTHEELFAKNGFYTRLIISE